MNECTVLSSYPYRSKDMQSWRSDRPIADIWHPNRNTVPGGGAARIAYVATQPCCEGCMTGPPAEFDVETAEVTGTLLGNVGTDSTEAHNA